MGDRIAPLPLIILAAKKDTTEFEVEQDDEFGKKP